MARNTYRSLIATDAQFDKNVKEVSKYSKYYVNFGMMFGDTFVCHTRVRGDKIESDANVRITDKTEANVLDLLKYSRKVARLLLAVIDDMIIDETLSVTIDSSNAKKVAPDCVKLVSKGLVIVINRTNSVTDRKIPAPCYVTVEGGGKTDYQTKRY